MRDEEAEWRLKHWGSMEQFMDLPEVDDTKLNQQKDLVLENKDFKHQLEEKKSERKVSPKKR